MDLKIFENEEFGSVRTVVVDGEIYFVAADVCRVPEIQNVTQAVSRLEDDERAMFNIGLPGGATNCVNEAGLYRLFFASRKPDAKKFQRWIFHEVIPQIRKTGSYSLSKVKDVESYKEIIADPDFIIAVGQALKAEKMKVAVLTQKNTKLTEENAVLTQQVAELQPKASYCDIVLKCKNLIPISIIAKDYGFTAIQMNNILHDLGVQYKIGGTWLLYKNYAQLGRTSTKTHTYENSEGERLSKVATYRTQKGRLGLYCLLKENGLLPLIELNDR